MNAAEMTAAVAALATALGVAAALRKLAAGENGEVDITCPETREALLDMAADEDAKAVRLCDKVARG